jgi:hypothetical protein
MSLPPFAKEGVELNKYIHVETCSPLSFGSCQKLLTLLRQLRLRVWTMSELKIIGTIRRSFDLLKKDPTLIVLFILPAILALGKDRII